jgi:DNA-binding response OmpR family regulator
VTILVVDDDPAVQDMLRMCLSVLGYTVAQATDAYSAAMVFRAAQPDAAILDLEMPAGSGDQVLRNIRATPAGSRLPVIFLSAKPRAQVQAIVPNAVNVSFLEKPLKVVDLKSTLEAMLVAAGKQPPAPRTAPSAAPSAAPQPPAPAAAQDDVLDLDAN